MLDTIRRVLLAVSLIVMGLGFSGCKDDGNGTPIQLAKIDMARMYGGWYLIATASRKFGWIFNSLYNFLLFSRSIRFCVDQSHS